MTSRFTLQARFEAALLDKGFRFAERGQSAKQIVLLNPATGTRYYLGRLGLLSISTPRGALKCSEILRNNLLADGERILNQKFRKPSSQQERDALLDKLIPARKAAKAASARRPLTLQDL